MIPRIMPRVLQTARSIAGRLDHSLQSELLELALNTNNHTKSTHINLQT